MDKYKEFLKQKVEINYQSGFEIDENVLNKHLEPFQKYIVKKALQHGRYAIFAECGLGKTIMQLEWAHQVNKHINKPVLILCPLSVSGQTIQEGVKFGIEVKRYDSSSSIQIVNYEQLDNIDCSQFAGVVLDESGILKNFAGSTKTKIIELFAKTPYKLACTATPSPNDEIEIGNHSEFLNVMSSTDMVAKFFTTDKDRISGNKYRLKKHGVTEFYKWIKSWSIVVSKPSDLGFEDTNYELPPLNIFEEEIELPKLDNGKLFNDFTVSATGFNEQLRQSIKERGLKAKQIVDSKPNESFIIWVNQDAEADFIKSIIPECVEVRGSMKPEEKESKLLAFANSEFRILLTKKKICQFGLNFQNCHNQIFATLDFSFEGLYQAIRRSYRSRQKEAVNIYLITTDTMQNVKQSIAEKMEKFKKMREEIIKLDNEYMQDLKVAGEVKRIENKNFTAINADCVEAIKTIQTESIDYSFFSPPFGALYVFSNDPRDLSNVQNDDEFYEHFKFLIPELFRILKPGRLVTMHIMQGTTLKGRDGYYSIKDFRGDLIRLFQEAGFYFHAETMIRKDPKTAAIRTKNRQLMHGTTKSDSSIVRSGLADYLITFRKPGDNQVPIQNNIPFDLWCKMAEPVWLEINESDTLPTQKEQRDERHITATQLKPIEWLYMMYCNQGETVFSPFMGIGSEGYQALKMKRKFIGIELKESYFNQAVQNLEYASEKSENPSLFDLMEV